MIGRPSSPRLGMTPRATPLAHRIIARVMPPDVAEYVIGDLVERDVRGLRLWRETAVALWSMVDNASSGGEMVSAFFGDLRHAARLLRRSPGFTITSVLTLGLGIGATTAIFSVIKPVIIEPLPYPRPDRLAMVWERNANGTHDNIGFMTYRDLVAQSKTIQSAAAVGSWFALINPEGGPERVNGDRVSWNYFRTLGVQPALGRDFTIDEDAPGKYFEVILSHGLWVRAFGGDSAVIGRAIPIGETPMTVVGIMPAGFQNVISPEAEIWRVLGYRDQPWTCRTCHHLRMIARFRPEVSLAAGQAELDAIHQRLEASYPTEYAAVGAAIVPVLQEMTKNFRPALLALTGAAVALMLIAIANVASMLLARAVRREEEFAVRTALGAGQGRLIRQRLTESLLLATLGGIAAIAVAATAIPLLVGQLPAAIPRLSEVRFSGFAFAVASALIFVATFVTGLVPASRRDVDLGASLRSGKRTAGGNRQLARSTLVVAEVALALMLLVGCGLLTRSVVGLLDVDPGFRAAGTLTLEINSVGAKYDSNEAIFAFQDRVRERVGKIPGVVSVAVTNQIPLGGNVDRSGVHALDKPRANPMTAPSGDRYSVTPGFLETMGVKLTSGRNFSPREAMDTANLVVLVSDALANDIWPGESAVGKQIRFGSIESPVRRVIGTTGNVRHTGLDATVTKQVYMPQRQWGADNQAIVVVRTASDPLALASTVRRAIHELDPTQPIVRVATMDQLISASTAQRRLALVLFVAFGATALLLAVAGIYGVLAGRVEERTREIGLRSALGATPGNILGLVVRQGMRLAALGLLIGLAAAWTLSRFLESMLFGIEPHDPVTMAGVAALLGVVTVVACLIPASRALRVEPTEALRSE